MWSRWSSVNECVFFFTFERRVVVQQLLTCVFWRVGEGCGSLAKAQATARVDVPTTLTLPLYSRSWWLGETCLAMMKMKVKHIHVCHSHCCINC